MGHEGFIETAENITEYHAEKSPGVLEVVARTTAAYMCLLEKERTRYILRDKRLLAHQVLMCLKNSL
jgi:hypothetical protein